jgi:anaerobic selenocysteine-containing dehydrogenase
MLYGLQGIFEAKRGDVFGLQFDEAWTRLLQRGGWWAPSYKNFEELWKLIQERGGWWDPLYDFGEWERIFQTPSKKFEFYAQGLKRVTPPNSRNDGDFFFLPHWEESKKAGEAKEFPLQLHIFKTMAVAGSRNANQPWLSENFGLHLFERWNTWVEINPHTARGLGISDGDWVWIESKFGKIKGKAKLYQGAMPDVVNIPFGLGHVSGGRWAKGLGSNPYQLLGDDLDPLTGNPMDRSPQVKIYKA